MTYKIIDYSHDPAGHYRLEIAFIEMRNMPVRDENGEPWVELEEVIVGVEDFLFADDDERWAGKPTDEIAAIHRSIVREALTAREELASRPLPSPTPMPGVGEEL